MSVYVFLISAVSIAGSPCSSQEQVRRKALQIEHALDKVELPIHFSQTQALGLKITALSWDSYEESMLYVDGVSNRIPICTE